MTQATDVFLSYKAEDRARLAPLVKALEAEGFTVWWDAHIGGGTNWREDIQQHLDAAKCVVVAWTKRSVGPDGNFVRDEASRAQRRHTYLPIRVDLVEPPLGFGEVQAISLQGWRGNRADPRYLALVKAVRSRIAGQDLPPIAPHIPGHFPGSGIHRRALLAGGAIAAAATGGWFLFKPTRASSKRIAVMPFANLSNDPEQAYFSEGIAEELRAALSRIGLEVIGRSSSDAVKDLDAKAIAARLGVANVLTGSIRRSRETIRVNAQLVSGSDGVQRWTQTYDRRPGDEIKIQTDIAANVAQAMSIAIGSAARAALSLGGTADSVAHDLLLQARQAIRDANGDVGLRKGLALADAALARDGNYANAYAEKASALLALARAANSPMEAARLTLEGERAANRAISLVPRLGAPHASLAEVAQNRVAYRRALHEVREALRLSPDDPNVLAPSCRLLVSLANGEEGLRLADRFIALDPINPLAYRRKTEILKLLRRYGQSIAAGRRQLEIFPNQFLFRLFIGDSLSLLGRYAEAKAEYAAMPTDDLFRRTGEAIVAARTRDIAAAKRIIGQAKQLFGASASYQYAEIYAQIGDRDSAFAEVENAVQARDSGLVYLKVDPFLDPIRADPRYAALIRQLNFP